MRKFFISYVFEDRTFKEQLKDWARQGLLGQWNAVAEEEDQRQGGARQIRNYLSPLISDSDVLVLLVGDNTHNHSWIDYEIQNARSAGKSVLTVRLPNTTGAGPASARHTSFDFRPDSIRGALARF